MIADEVVQHIRDRLLSDQPADAARAISSYVDDLFPLLPADDRRRTAADLGAELLGLGPLQQLMDDPDVEEILVNAGRDVWIDRHGTLQRAGRLRPGQAEVVLERVLLPLGLRIDRTSPTVDARLADGSRVSAVVAPLAVDGTCIAIRRFRWRAVELDAFGDEQCVDTLLDLVDRRCNVIVSGATSAGKTTLLNALARRIPDGERIITIEDTAELRLAADHVVRLECRPATVDGPGATTVRDLLRAALRLRPDRLVVGEVRGAEAIDMIQALNTGHDGSLSTCHANSPDDAIRRVETMALQGGAEVPLGALREQIHSCFDAVVQVQRAPGGRRIVGEIAEVAHRVDPENRTITRWRDGRTMGELGRRR
ncbi:MAG: CpaF family protein [Acidimicrobiia bacterium]